MALRYLVALGSTGEQDADLLRRAAAAGLYHVHVPGIPLVLTDRPEKVLAFSGGALLGPVFRRNGHASAIQSVEPQEAAEFVGSSGRVLIDEFWGSYVAVLRSGAEFVALRDPSGTRPCSYVDRDGVIFLASDPAMLIACGLLTREADWFGLARSLYWPGLPSERTAIAELKDLLPGNMLRVAGGIGVQTSVWNPWSYTEQDDRVGCDATEAELRRVAGSCHAAWSGVYGSGLVALSGGLDSSIVATNLKSAGNALSCVTISTADPLGDERKYCRSLTEFLDVPLYEGWYELSDVNLDRSVVAHRPRPYGRLDALAFDAAARRTAASAGSGAIFSGNGGDSVFFLSHSARSVVDRYLAQGLTTGVLRTARDIAELTGASLGQVAKQAIRLKRNATNAYTWRANPTLLSSDAIRDQASEPIHHSWLDLPSRRAGPGKAAHIAMLMRIQHSIEGYDQIDGMPVVHPLISQPIVECCLSIPTWRQCEGGRDRAVARKAFANLLPVEIAHRRGKGSPQGFTYQIFDHFREEIRQRLLDGQLAASGVLDRRALERALRHDTAADGAQILRLMLLVDTEAWVRSKSAGHAVVG